MVSHYHDQFDFSSEEYYENTINDRITKHEQIKKLIIDCMRRYRRADIDKLIKGMAKSSAVVAVVQLVKIYCAWEISDTSNVIEDENLFTAEIYWDLHSVADGVVNALTATSQAYQLWDTWENLSSTVKWLRGARVAVFLGLAYGNYRTNKFIKGRTERQEENERSS